MMKRTIGMIGLVMVVFLTTWTDAEARVKLTALPERGDVTIRLDNPRATLIEEERVLTLQKGLNKVDFSWKGVSIDADSIRLQPMSHPGQVTLLNVSYPPGEAALVWEIASPAAYEEKVRISYLLFNIDRLITYKLVANKAEDKTAFRSFIVLRNFSGEDFAQARILLEQGEGYECGTLHEETKQILFLSKNDVANEKVWTFDSAKLPWDPEKERDNVGIPVSYHIAHDQNNSLGNSALWAGKVRVYQEDGSGGTIFLGEDNTDLVPFGEKMKVYIGDSRDIVVTQRQMKQDRINIRRNSKNRVVLHDTDEIIEAEIENFKDSPARLTMIQHIDGQWEMKESNFEYEKKNASTLEYQIELPARGKKKLTMHYQRRNIRP